MKLIHWINPTAATSGMYSYIAQCIRVANQLGHHATYAYCNRPEPEPAVLMHYGAVLETVSHKTAEEKDCINIIHSGIPANFNRLPNKVFETHGTPRWIMKDWDALSYTSFMAKNCSLVVTRWPSQVPYWQALTDKPVKTIPPGVDLELWKPDGPKKEFTNHPLILWADTWREGLKEPWELLYALKMIMREIPSITLKLVNIPSEKMDLLHYFIGVLGIGSAIEWPVEARVQNIAEYYRTADWVFSAHGEGSNVTWEAQACGAKIGFGDVSSEAIARQILRDEYDPAEEEKPDLRKTIESQVNIFENLACI